MLQNLVVVNLCVQAAMHILPTSTLQAESSNLGVQVADIPQRQAP